MPTKLLKYLSIAQCLQNEGTKAFQNTLFALPKHTCTSNWKVFNGSHTSTLTIYILPFKY